jgi:hypothetical protein
MSSSSSSGAVDRDAIVAGAVRLRHVDAASIVDRSSPSLAAGMSDAEVAAHIGSLLDFNIEVWLPLLGDCTFATEFVPLSVDDARQLRDACAANDATGVGALAERLAPALARQMADNGDRGAFVKLSSRSAKDAPGASRALDAAFHARCPPDASENARLRLLFEIATDFMRMRSAPQVVAALVASERVLQDMNVALQRLDRFHENIVVRRWTDIAVDMEFRGFVHCGRLCALSQYNHVFHSERVVALRDSILRLIVDAFERTIRARLAPKFDSYVVDFALTGGRFAFDAAAAADAERVWVIELNPFASSTDGALFSWRNDSAVLLGGDGTAPIEFRVRTEYEPSVRAQLEMRWRELLVKPRHQVSAGGGASVAN